MKHLPGHLHLPSISPVAYAAITHQRLLLSCHPRQKASGERASKAFTPTALEAFGCACSDVHVISCSHPHGLFPDFARRKNWPIACGLVDTPIFCSSSAMVAHVFLASLSLRIISICGQSALWNGPTLDFVPANLRPCELRSRSSVLRAMVFKR